MSKREAENDLKFIRLMLKAWCVKYNAECRMEVYYHADLDDDDSKEN